MRVVKTSFLIVLAVCISIGTIWTVGETEAEAAGKKDNVIELWHGWGAGGEVEAVNNLMNGFKEKYGVTIKDRTIPDGHVGINRQMGIALIGGKPPEVFLTGPGYRCKVYQTADRLEPLDSEDWAEIEGDKIFPEGLIKLMRWDDNAWTIPLNIHCINAIWYNVAIFKKYNLEPPKSLDEFRQVCNVLKENGETPLTGASGPWPLFALYPFLVKTLGPDGYIALAEGAISWKDERIREAFSLYKELWIDNLIENWSGYDLWAAGQLLINGEAAMYWGMGDWMAAWMAHQDFEPIKDFDFFIAPIPEEVFIGQIDSFSMVKGAGDPDLAEKFLKYCASVDGQARFARYKGSLAANLRVPKDVYSPINKRLHDYINKPGVTFLPNFELVIIPDFSTLVVSELGKYALDPTSEALDELLETLENYRLEAFTKGQWMKWQ